MPKLSKIAFDFRSPFLINPHVSAPTILDNELDNTPAPIVYIGWLIRHSTTIFFFDFFFLFFMYFLFFSKNLLKL